MQRHRKIAAAPLRSASEAWETIRQLVVDTLDRSPSIPEADVAAAMACALPVGRMLIAGGHLDHHPIVLVADPVHLSIKTVSGQAAAQLEEKLDPVPGGASAVDWIIYLPTPDPLEDLVVSIVAGNPHLSADDPPSGQATEAASVGNVVNLEALARREQNR